jgi:hypothetical protein
VTPRAYWDRHGDLWEASPDGRSIRLVWASGEHGPRTFVGGPLIPAA